jgi:DNA repair exonuclease SbcCD ATPase subunit
MIKFKSLSVKNFLSVGNTPITLDLSGSGKKVLCLGKNGSGKSSILIDGITFALFGKSYRNINKPQLVNSINEKDCVTEIEFDIDGKGAFKVIRGIAPSILEIYQNGTIINIDSARKDYQRYLEQHILGMNYE